MQTVPTYVAPHGLLRGKSVLVTAAAGAGIGFAMAKRAAEEGCRALFISDVHEKRLAAAAQTIREETGLQAVYTRLCNVSAQDQVSALVSEADQTLGGIDVLVNNAGLGTSHKVVDMADQEWDQVIGVTLTGTFRMMRAALAVMQPRGCGVIINNASVLGWRAQAEQAHCRSQSRRDGADPLRGAGGGRVRCPHQCGGALHRNTRLPQKICAAGTAGSAFCA